MKFNYSLLTLKFQLEVYEKTFSLFVFGYAAFILLFQCVSTYAIQRKEAGSYLDSFSMQSLHMNAQCKKIFFQVCHSYKQENTTNQFKISLKTNL